MNLKNSDNYIDTHRSRNQSIYFLRNARGGLVVDLAQLFGSGYEAAECSSGGARSFFAMCPSILSITTGSVITETTLISVPHRVQVSGDISQIF